MHVYKVYNEVHFSTLAINRLFHDLHLAMQTITEEQNVPTIDLGPEDTAWEHSATANGATVNFSAVAEAFWTAAVLQTLF